MEETLNRLAILKANLNVLETHYQNVKNQLFNLEGMAKVKEFMDERLTTEITGIQRCPKWKDLKQLFEEKYGKTYSHMLKAEMELKYGRHTWVGWTDVVYK